MTMHPIQHLMDEHDVILQVLTAIEQRSITIPTGESLDVAYWERVHDFLCDYADGRHHGKEEGLLFPCLGELGFGLEQGPVAVMTDEHRLARRLTASLADSIAARDPEGIERAAQGYALLLREHIQKENMVLFEAARQRIPAATADELEARFAAFDARDERDWQAIASALCADAGCAFRPPRPPSAAAFEV